MQLLYRGKGIARGRVENLEKLTVAARADLTVRAPESASIEFRFGPDILAGVEEAVFEIPGSVDPFTLIPLPGGGHRVDDLPAGEYGFGARGTWDRPKDSQIHEGKCTSVWRVVTVKAGENRAVTLGEADRSKN